MPGLERREHGCPHYNTGRRGERSHDVTLSVRRRDRLRCQLPSKDRHGKFVAAAREPVVLYSTVFAETSLINEMSFICPGFSKINIILRLYTSNGCLAGLISSFVFATLHRSTPRSLLESLRYLPAQFDIVGCREWKHHLQKSNVICTCHLRFRHQSKESCDSNLITR